MLLKELLKPSRIYPVVLVIAMMIVWQYRTNNKSSSKNNQELSNIVILKGKTMGTYYDIRYLDSSQFSLQPEIDSIFSQFINEASTWVEESEISQFNLHDTLSNFSTHIKILIEASNVIYQETNGAFDPTVGPLVNAWGFGEKFADEVPSQKKVDSLLQFVGYDKIILSEDGTHLSKPKGVYLNLSAIAKGYGCDIIADFLRSKNYKNFKVEIGGEVVCEGTNEGRKWHIGIEKPNVEKSTLHTIIELENKAMATSGNYRNYLEKNGVKYAHTIDPMTGKPIQLEVLSASVIGDNCMVADAYATAFMVMGLEKIKKFCEKRNDINVLIIYENDGKERVWMTEGMRKHIVI